MNYITGLQEAEVARTCGVFVLVWHFKRDNILHIGNEISSVIFLY